MSFVVGDVDLGPTFDVLEELEELEKAGFTRAFVVLESEGEAKPSGTQEEARHLLDSQPSLSRGAMFVLRRLAGDQPSDPGKH